jgi:hypothetical protein
VHEGSVLLARVCIEIYIDAFKILFKEYDWVNSPLLAYSFNLVNYNTFPIHACSF